LEAAPFDLLRAEWGLYREDVTGIKTEVGTGKRNTELIIAALNSKGETGRAAQLCRSFMMSGYSDWFLPSKDELDLMYKNLKQKGLGGFSNNSYWSSSQNGNYGNFAWVQRFSDGNQTSTSETSTTRFVRAVRAF
jgi:hypothetical protein